MRIISGKYKGHQLVAFKASHIRPTTDRVKETLFNMLMSYIDEAMVLDLFAGTGNLGLEALSRGAEHVTFVEKHPQSLMILKKNIEKLKIDSGSYKISAENVFVFLKKQRDVEYDLIFADPPFTEKIAHDVMMAISESKVYSSRTMISIESHSSERIDDSYGKLKAINRREFGDKILTFFQESEEA